MLSFFPRGVLDEILNLIESVSDDFPSYSFKIKLFFSGEGGGMLKPKQYARLSNEVK